MTSDLGWLDTNVFVHSLCPNDPFYRRCKAIIDGLERGTVSGWLHPVVIHELTYVLLTRVPTFIKRVDVHEYIRTLVLCPSVATADRDAVLEALARWEILPRVSFADALLAGLSRTHHACSVNKTDFEGIRSTFLSVSI